MDDETTASEHPPTSNGHLSRRTVLRAAGHAAWAVPAIQFVSQAPAFAAASDTLAITAASGTWNLPGNYVDCAVTVMNNSTTDPTAGLQVTLTFPNFYVYVRTGPPPNRNKTLSFTNISTGWGTPTISYSGTTATRIATVVFTRTGTQLAVGASTPLTFRATTTRDVTTASGIDTISVVATATEFVAGSGTINPA